MGWTSCKLKQKVETVRLWCRLRNMTRDRLCRKVHEWSLTVNGSWEKTMIKFINDLNISQIMLCNNPNKNTCINKVKEKLLVSEHSDWFSKLNKPGNENNGNKLRTYRLYKYNLQTEYYVKCNLRKDQRRIIAKFRSCNLPLAIETGRYTRPKTPVNERICKYCSSGDIDDEIHFLINCDFFDDIRYHLFYLTSLENSFFNEYTTDQKLIYLMTADHLQTKLASCLQKMINRRNSMHV